MLKRSGLSLFATLGLVLAISGLAAFADEDAPSTTPTSASETQNGQNDDGDVKEADVDNGEVEQGQADDGDVENGQVDVGDVEQGQADDGDVQDGQADDGEVKQGHVDDGTSEDAATAGTTAGG